MFLILTRTQKGMKALFLKIYEPMMLDLTIIFVNACIVFRQRIASWA